MKTEHPRTAFDHPSHRAAEELSAEARRLILAEKTDEARELYARAAREELVVARTLDSRKETEDLAVSYTRKMRSILAISGVACFVKAQRWDEAAEAAREFLALPILLLPDGTRDLEEFLRQAQPALTISTPGYGRVVISRRHQPGDGGPSAFDANPHRLDPPTHDGLTSARMQGWDRQIRGAIVYVERNAPALAAHLEASETMVLAGWPPPAVTDAARAEWESLAAEFPALLPIE